MSSGKRTIAVVTAVVVILAAGGYLTAVMMRGETIAADRAWKCTKCGHVFEREFEPDPWAIANVDRDGRPKLEEEACPKCGGAAHLLVTMVCGKCGHVFQHLEEIEPGAREPKPPTCPKCQSTSARPRAPNETEKPQG